MIRISHILCAAFLVTAFSAHAIVIDIADNLVLSQEDAPGIQQSDQGPCVIGDPSCNSNVGALIDDFTLLPAGGQIDSYMDIYSPTYNVGDFRAEAGDTFSIGIDINVQGNGTSAHALLAFVAEIDGEQRWAYSGMASLSESLNPGNGFSDWRLSGFDLTGVSDESSIRFGLDLQDVDAGRDQFFVVAGTSMVPTEPVPEPGPLAILGFALLILGGLRVLSRGTTQ